MAARAPFVIAGHESRPALDRLLRFRLPNFIPTRHCIFPLKWFMGVEAGRY